MDGASLLINAALDAVLYEESTGASANGAGEYLLAGRTNQSSGSRPRSLLLYDLSALASGAIVLSATAQLQAVPEATTSGHLNLHRMLAPRTTATSDPAGNESAGVAALAGDTSWLNASFPSTL